MVHWCIFGLRMNTFENGLNRPLLRRLQYKALFLKVIVCKLVWSILWSAATHCGFFGYFWSNSEKPWKPFLTFKGHKLITAAILPKHVGKIDRKLNKFISSISYVRKNSFYSIKIWTFIKNTIILNYFPLFL